MSEPFLHRLDIFARSIFPFLVTLGLILLTAAPVRVPEISAIMPALSLIAVYHFTVRHPRLLPYWATFMLGVLQDLIAGGAVGASAVVLLLIQFIIRNQYRFFAAAPFALAWGLFFVLGAGAFVGDWLLNSLGMVEILDARPTIFRYLLTVALYPVLTLILIKGEALFQDRDAVR